MSRANTISRSATPRQPRKNTGRGRRSAAARRKPASRDSRRRRGARRRARIGLIRNSRRLELFHATKERISPVKRAYKYHPCSVAFPGRSNIPVKETIPPSKQLSSSLFRCQIPPPTSFHVYLPNLLCFKARIPPDAVSGGTSQQIHQVLLLNLE